MVSSFLSNLFWDVNTSSFLRQIQQSIIDRKVIKTNVMHKPGGKTTTTKSRTQHKFRNGNAHNM